jgi:hypothetical protein
MPEALLGRLGDMVRQARRPPPPPSYYVDTPRPSPRTDRTRRVPHPVLIGHAASLTPSTMSGATAAPRGVPRRRGGGRGGSCKGAPPPPLKKAARRAPCSTPLCAARRAPGPQALRPLRTKVYCNAHEVLDPAGEASPPPPPPLPRPRPPPLPSLLLSLLALPTAARAWHAPRRLRIAPVSLR